MNHFKNKCAICNKVIEHKDSILLISGPIVAEQNGDYSIVDQHNSERICHVGCILEVNLNDVLNIPLSVKIKHIEDRIFDTLKEIGEHPDHPTLYNIIEKLGTDKTDTIYLEEWFRKRNLLA